MKRLVQAEPDLAGNAKDVGSFEELADAFVLRIENLAEVEDLVGLDQACHVVVHGVADNHAADSRLLDAIEGRDEMLDLFYVAHAPDEQDDLSIRNAEFALDCFARVGHLRQGVEVDRIAGYINLMAVLRPDIGEGVLAVEDDGVAAGMDIIEWVVA